MIDFACGQCGKAFQVGDHLAGKSGKCKQCGAPIRIPAKANAANAAAASTEEYVIEPDLSGVRPNQMLDLLGDADPLGVMESLSSQAVEEYEPPTLTRGYTYKMVQIPPNIQVMQGTSTQGRAAAYLEDVVNEHAADGWDFYRVDPIGIQVNPGCIMALLGMRSQIVNYYVITFRRPIGT